MDVLYNLDHEGREMTRKARKAFVAFVPFVGFVVQMLRNQVKNDEPTAFE